MRSFSTILLAGAAAVLAGACLNVEVDPDLAGVYACVSDEDCPGEQSCFFEACQAVEPPQLTISTPEDEEAFQAPDGGGEVSQIVRITGTNLELVDPAADPDVELGKGHIAVFVDGEQIAEITSGDLTGGVTLEGVPVEGTPGVHRIRAIARTSEGVNYPNPEADARRIFWLDDGQPRVAFKNIWPRQAFPLEASEVFLEMAAINFKLEPPAASNADGEGHTHIYFDEMFPACIEDQVCDAGSAGIVPDMGDGPGPVGSVALPNAAAGEYGLTAVLRERTHSAYDISEGDEEPQFVWETIPIIRSADAEPPTAE